MKPLVVGHRGAAAYALENTALSFQKAIELGADWIELDIHESLDGQFMVLHDSHLGRISPRCDLVRKTRSNDLKAIELYQGQKLLDLHETFEIIPTAIGLMVEVKALRSFAKLARFLEQSALSRKLMLTSFDLLLLSKIQAFSRKFPLGVVSKTPKSVLKAQQMGIIFSDICLDFQHLTSSLVARWHDMNFRIFAWTVDRPEDIGRVLHLEVDGVISNRPDLIRAVLASKLTCRKT
jgi:glycerophosphoryl diester phosphodiesterase